MYVYVCAGFTRWLNHILVPVDQYGHVIPPTKDLGNVYTYVYMYQVHTKDTRCTPIHYFASTVCTMCTYCVGMYCHDYAPGSLTDYLHMHYRVRFVTIPACILFVCSTEAVKTLFYKMHMYVQVYVRIHLVPLN